jgi:hypothetical protein
VLAITTALVALYAFVATPASVSNSTSSPPASSGEPPYGGVGRVVAVELCDSAFKRQLAASNLELLHEISGASTRHAPSILD